MSIMYLGSENVCMSWHIKLCFVCHLPIFLLYTELQEFTFVAHFGCTPVQKTKLFFNKAAEKYRHCIMLHLSHYSLCRFPIICKANILLQSGTIKTFSFSRMIIIFYRIIGQFPQWFGKSQQQKLDKLSTQFDTATYS